MNPADMRCLLATSLIALLASLAFAATPASAVETGVNETMHQNLPVGKTASGLGAEMECAMSVDAASARAQIVGRIATL